MATIRPIPSCLPVPGREIPKKHGMDPDRKRSEKAPFGGLNLNTFAVIFMMNEFYNNSE